MPRAPSAEPVSSSGSRSQCGDAEPARGSPARGSRGKAPQAESRITSPACGRVASEEIGLVAGERGGRRPQDLGPLIPTRLGAAPAARAPASRTVRTPRLCPGPRKEAPPSPACCREPGARPKTGSRSVCAAPAPPKPSAPQVPRDRRLRSANPPSGEPCGHCAPVTLAVFPVGCCQCAEPRSAGFSPGGPALPTAPPKPQTRLSGCTRGPLFESDFHRAPHPCGQGLAALQAASAPQPVLQERLEALSPHLAREAPPGRKEGGREARAPGADPALWEALPCTPHTLKGARRGATGAGKQDSLERPGSAQDRTQRHMPLFPKALTGDKPPGQAAASSSCSR